MIRRLAREVALQALFQIDFTGNEVEQAVDAALDEHEELHPEAAVDKALDQHKELGQQVPETMLRSILWCLLTVL